MLCPVCLFLGLTHLSFWLVDHVFRGLVCELYQLLLPPCLNSIYPLSFCAFGSNAILKFSLVLASLKIWSYSCFLRIIHLGVMFCSVMFNPNH